MTLYFVAWGNNHEDSIETRLKDLKSDISPDAFEVQVEQTNQAHRLSYRLIEDDVQALYGFVVSRDGHLQSAVYFDDESEIDVARDVLASIRSMFAEP